MSTKLTLTLDSSVIDKAKKYAKNQGRSLSNLIEDYLRSVTSEKSDKDDIILSSNVKSLLGSVRSLPQDVDYKDILAEELLKKYRR